jgi:hypothetical protein
VQWRGRGGGIRMGRDLDEGNAMRRMLAVMVCGMLAWLYNEDVRCET